ncbi:MAG: hypothetical protein OXH52_09005 [Gammaproteobacteria bacterium]|nr:hypothetical protein [Gammaproteobacteria bacterium]
MTKYIVGGVIVILTRWAAREWGATFLDASRRLVLRLLSQIRDSLHHQPLMAPPRQLYGFIRVTEGTTPPEPRYDVREHGVELVPPWQRAPPPGTDPLWISAAFAGAPRDGGAYRTLPPRKRKLNGSGGIFAADRDSEEWHARLQPGDGFLRYRLERTSGFSDVLSLDGSLHAGNGSR